MMAFRRSFNRNGWIPANNIISVKGLQWNESRPHLLRLKQGSFHLNPMCGIHCTSINFNNENSLQESSVSSNASLRKRLDVAIVGAPNAGKSQLLNSLVGSKVAAVSKKRHTTRTGILGALTCDDTQLVFIDTPGFLHHEMSVNEGVRKLLSETSSEMESADYVLLVVDAVRRIEEDLRKTLITLMLLALRSHGRVDNRFMLEKAEIVLSKLSVVLNKVDLVHPKENLLATAADIGSMAECCVRLLLQQRRCPTKVRLGDLVDHVMQKHADESGFEGVHEDDKQLFVTLTPEFFYTSAITKDDEGLDDVLGMLLERATPSDEWIVDAESNTSMSPVEVIEEVIREKIYRCLHKEVPHNVQQQNRIFQWSKLKYPTNRNDSGTTEEDDHNPNVLSIHQDLIVRTRSHQRLVLGSGGKTLERIRLTASNDLEKVFKCTVDLNLNVCLNKSHHDKPLESESLGPFSLSSSEI